MTEAATSMSGSQKPEQTRGRTLTRVIAIASGKGGVGKTNSSVNLAVAFAGMGRRVLLLDADLGLGNIDVLLGLSPRHNISHLLRGERTIGEVLVDGPSGVKILTAASGVPELTDLTTEQRLGVAAHLAELGGMFDILIVDTGAGISSNVLFFTMAAQEIVVVVSPEPTSLTDAYALMKVLFSRYGERSFKLIVNQVKTKRGGLDVYRKISLAAERFLDVSIDYLGCVLADENVPRSVVEQRPVVELYPESTSSLCYREIAGRIEDRPINASKGGMQFFFEQMLGTGS